MIFRKKQAFYQNEIEPIGKNQKALDMHHASPMMEKIAGLRAKYDLHMKVERYVPEGDGMPEADRRFMREWIDIPAAVQIAMARLLLVEPVAKLCPHLQGQGLLATGFYVAPPLKEALRSKISRGSGKRRAPNQYAQNAV